MTDERLRFDPEENLKRILASPTYVRAEDDSDFIGSPRLRPIRLSMELLKAEIVQEREGINSTIVLFGGTRIIEESQARARLEQAQAALAEVPDAADRQRAVRVAESILAKSPFYEEARRFARIVSEQQSIDGHKDNVIVTGGGPGIMEAGNRGAQEAGAVSLGLNITLPHEQAPNPYISSDLCFQFHYFAIRKMHFLMRAKALVAFPGGFGTLDELFETLTLIQTQKVKPVPVLLFGQEFWSRVIDFDFLIQEGTISPEDVDIFQYVETAEEAWKAIAEFYNLRLENV